MHKFSGIVFGLILPILICFLLNYAIGRNPKDMKMGIVNYESSNCSRTDAKIEGTCPNQNLSCFFLNEIHADIFQGIPYNSREKALKDSKRTKIFGFIEIGANFTTNFVGEELLSINDKLGVSRVVHNNSEIAIHIDETDLIRSMFVKREVFFAFSRFIDKFTESCRSSKGSFSSPLNMDETLNGKLGDEQTGLMMIGTIIQ